MVMGCNYGVIELKYQPHSRSVFLTSNQPSNPHYLGTGLGLNSHQTKTQHSSLPPVSLFIGFTAYT